MPRIADVIVPEDTFDGLAMTVALPDIPIIDDDGSKEVPADDLPGFIAREIGLDPAELTDEQRDGIAKFIATYTL